MKLFVGLGNPGQKYARNRHNVGCLALDEIVREAGIGPWRKRFHSLICEGEIGGTRVLLIKPQTFYNESGRAVRDAAKFHKIKVADIVVFHDEIDLAPGKLRVKTGGGLAGNNGLRSISSHLGPDFVRVRIGVGHPGDKNKVANYVLRDFTKSDGNWLDTLLAAVAGSAHRLAQDDHERFQTDVAQAMTPLKPGASSSDASDAPPGPSRSGASRPSSKAGTRSAPAKVPPKNRPGAPSQLELAKQSAAPRKKPSRRIKKGPVAQHDVTETATTTAETKDDSALAARLKR
ncbi:MAG: aminoacyl-tRNA hydrolase, partial [Hyphomicrobiaceae bacterium]